MVLRPRLFLVQNDIQLFHRVCNRSFQTTTQTTIEQIPPESDDIRSVCGHSDVVLQYIGHRFELRRTRS